jgi:hypothetical protein
MIRRHLNAVLLFGSVSLLIAGCSTAPPDSVEATDPVSGTAFLQASSWHSGNAFLIDKTEGLLLTSERAVHDRTKAEVIFPAIDNGKVLTKKSTFMHKGTKVEATVLTGDAVRDLAVVQLDKPAPESAAALKLASAGPAKDAAVQFLGAPSKSNLIWTLVSANVQTVAPKEFTVGGKNAIKARVIELNAEGSAAKEVNGGPVVNEKNEVIGVIADDAAQTGSLVCIDISEVRTMLASAYCKLATQSIEKKNYDRAIACAERALANNKNDPLSWNERGVAYSMKNQFDKAIADYSEAIKLNPKFTGALRNRASAYLHLGKYQEAVDDCTVLIDLAPKFAQGYELRRQAYLKLRQKDKADLDARYLKALGGPDEWKAVGSTGNKPPD